MSVEGSERKSAIDVPSMRVRRVPLGGPTCACMVGSLAACERWAVSDGPATSHALSKLLLLLLPVSLARETRAPVPTTQVTFHVRSNNVAFVGLPSLAALRRAATLGVGAPRSSSFPSVVVGAQQPGCAPTEGPRWRSSCSRCSPPLQEGARPSRGRLLAAAAALVARRGARLDRLRRADPHAHRCAAATSPHFCSSSRCCS